MTYATLLRRNFAPTNLCSRGVNALRAFGSTVQRKLALRPKVLAVAHGKCAVWSPPPTQVGLATIRLSRCAWQACGQRSPLPTQVGLATVAAVHVERGHSTMRPLCMGHAANGTTSNASWLGDRGRCSRRTRSTTTATTADQQSYGRWRLAARGLLQRPLVPCGPRP